MPCLDGMRVLILLGGSELFGSERANIEVFRNLKEMGLQARFITNSKYGKPEIQPALTCLGFEWTTAPFGYHWSRNMLGKHFGYFLLNIYGVMATSWRVWREVRHWKPTHLYVTTCDDFSYALPAVFWLNLPLIYRAGDELPKHSWFHRWLITRLAARVSIFVCVSRFIRETCATAVPNGRMQMIYSYPPSRAAGEPLALPTVRPGVVMLAYLGQLSQHKGILVLLDAVEGIIKQGKNIGLWIAGSTGRNETFFLKSLKQRVAAAGMAERIFFLSYTSAVDAVLARTDIHVCPSLFAEPLPNVVLEAKLAGKPSVIFPVGGIPELIEHKVDGYICRDCSVEALVEGISYYLDRPDERGRAGVAARKSLEEKFGLERFRKQWAEVFLQTTA